MILLVDYLIINHDSETTRIEMIEFNPCVANGNQTFLKPLVTF